MKPEDAASFPAARASLKDGRAVVLRLLRTEDGERLAEFYAAVPPEDHRFYCPHPLTREKAMEKAAAAEDPRLVCLLAVAADEAVAGYAWYRWQDDRSERSGFGMCVRPGWQGSGLGGALMGRLLEIASRIGPAVMSLTVQEANPRAVRLYQKMGFVIVRKQLRQRDQEPEYYMERSVRP